MTTITKLAHHTSTSDGAADFFDAARYAAQALTYLPIGTKNLNLAHKVSSVFEITANSFYVIDFFTDVEALRKKTHELKDAFEKKTVVPLKIAAEKFVYSVLIVIGTAKDAAMLVQQVLGKMLPLPLQVVGTTAAIATGLVDLKEEFEDISAQNAKLKQSLPKHTFEIVNEENKKTYYKLAKTIAFLAIDALSLISIAFLTYWSMTLALSPVFLICSSVVVAMNIAIYLASESIKEKQLVCP